MRAMSPSTLRILVVGSGGVGDAFARIAVQRDFFALLVMSDYDEARASATVAAATARRPGEARLLAAKVDASSSGSVAALARAHSVTYVLNAALRRLRALRGRPAVQPDRARNPRQGQPRGSERPRRGDLRPSFSIWTTIEECLNPVAWEKDPATTGPRMTGKTCAGRWVTGIGKNGEPA